MVYITDSKYETKQSECTGLQKETGVFLDTDTFRTSIALKNVSPRSTGRSRPHDLELVNELRSAKLVPGSFSQSSAILAAAFWYRVENAMKLHSEVLKSSNLPVT
jgi:hypothetical protein